MGLLVNGKWQDAWYDTQKTQGKFVREQSQFRNWITPDGKAGTTGLGGFAAESNRYHLYVSYACPWAHRTLIFRELKNLTAHIDVSIVHPHMLENGWEFKGNSPEVKDKLFLSQFLYEIYLRAKPDYSGRVTVPVLWDKQTQTIVNNESAEIIRMFNSAFNHLTGNKEDFYPERHQSEIDNINAFVYDNINNGVYRAGFATTQAAYEEAFDSVFAALDQIEGTLSNQDFLVGNSLTEADIRLFTTLIRFDAVYYSHFKCNLRRIADYPLLFSYLKTLYHYPGVAQTVKFDHIKQHYYYSQTKINPTQIVPKGPLLDLG